MKVLSISLLILGCMIGAGLASGKEVVLFFAKFGFISIFFAAALAVIIFFGLKLFLICGQKNVEFTIDFKKVKSKTITNAFFAAVNLFFSVAMLAGVNSAVSGLICPLPLNLWALAAAMLCSLIVWRGMKLIKIANAVLVPIMVFLMLLVCTLTLTSLSISSPAFSFDFLSVGSLSLLTPLYAGCNLILAYPLVKQLGQSLTKKQTNAVCFLVALTIFTTLSLLIITLLSVDCSHIYSDLPICDLAYFLGQFWGKTYGVVLFLSIFTTLISTFFNAQSCGIKLRYVCIFSFVLSFIGFNSAVQYTYPVLGALGLLFIHALFRLSPEPLFEKRNKKVHSTR